jgi:pilus assembly protein CpaF
VDARLPDGSRVNAIIPPISLVGPVLTVRKFSRTPMTIDDLVRNNSLSQEMADFLKACVMARLNIIVSGGTGSGKTTLLNVLSSFIPEDERIVTIEDAAELQLGQDHLVSLEARPANIEGKGMVTIRDLVANALRMRPDRIVVGEVRRGEALDMLSAMNTGHDGSMTTAHANSPRDVLARLETMVLMAGMDLPLKAVRDQISKAVDVVVQAARLQDGSRRITHISEIQGMEGEVITMQDIFEFEQIGFRDGRVIGELRPSGIRPKFVERFAALGIHMPTNIFGATYADAGAAQ